MKQLPFFFLIIICAYSCKPVIKKLGANPKVSYYIVGRLRTAEIKSGVPFRVEVSSLNPQLIEKPIKFKIENMEQFSLSYSIDNKDEVKECIFGKEINDASMRLIITKADFLNSITSENIKNIDYQFQVKGEE